MFLRYLCGQVRELDRGFRDGIILDSMYTVATFALSSLYWYPNFYEVREMMRIIERFAWCLDGSFEKFTMWSPFFKWEDYFHLYISVGLGSCMHIRYFFNSPFPIATCFNYMASFISEISQYMAYFIGILLMVWALLRTRRDAASGQSLHLMVLAWFWKASPKLYMMEFFLPEDLVSQTFGLSRFNRGHSLHHQGRKAMEDSRHTQMD